MSREIKTVREVAVGLQLCILDMVKRKKEGRAIRTVMMIERGENAFHSMNILFCACPRR
jgi:hypothetical protein